MVSLFGRSKVDPQSELKQSIANGVTQVVAGKQTGDEEQRRNLAEDYMLLKDPKVDNLLFGMSSYKYVDNEGLMGDKGNEYVGAIPKNVAIAVSHSSLIRSGWISEKQARIMVLQNESLYLRRTMLMTEEEYEEGGELLMDSLRKLDDVNVLCSINGRLGKLVKSRPHNIDVNVGTTPQGKGGNIQ
jgi:hypothetical protein